MKYIAMPWFALWLSITLGGCAIAQPVAQQRDAHGHDFTVEVTDRVRNEFDLQVRLAKVQENTEAEVHELDGIWRHYARSYCGKHFYGEPEALRENQHYDGPVGGTITSLAGVLGHVRCGDGN
jgi:hypothetical protein